MEVFNQFGAVPFIVGETRSKEEIEESLIWQRLTETKIFQFTSAISRVQFSPIEPHSIVILSGLNGPWIDGKQKYQKFAFAKTKTPFSAVSFRKDGVLIALGREDGIVDVYPTHDHQTLLRRFKLNCGTIFSLTFSPFSNSIVVGCGNGTIHILDISRVHQPIVIKAHKDAVSSIIPLESGNIWVSGSHDNLISLWDFNTQNLISQIEAPSSISKMVSKGNRIFASIGESIFVVDILSKITKVGIFTFHTRPIVGLSIVRSTLVTASADKSIKIIDPSSFLVLHSLKMHNDITAFDCKHDASSFVVALTGGIVQIKYLINNENDNNKDIDSNLPTMPSNFRLFQRTKSNKKERWNQRLRKFEFAEALDLTLKENDPSIIIGMIDELDRLGGLEVSLSGRDPNGIIPILKFFVNNISNPLWSHVILKAILCFVRIYRQVINDVPAVSKIFDELSEKIKTELNLQMRASELIGKIDLLI